MLVVNVGLLNLAGAAGAGNISVRRQLVVPPAPSASSNRTLNSATSPPHPAISITCVCVIRSGGTTSVITP